MTETRWWQPGRHQDRRPFLLARNAIQAALRSWFSEQGFVEVDPAILQHSPGNETHLHAFGTRRQSAEGEDLGQFYLHTSPEFAMKKLIAAGETQIFAFTHAFRNREAGSLHSSEFTMLEWYRTDCKLEQLMADCDALLALVAQTIGTTMLQYKSARADTGPCERLGVTEAFQKYAQVDLLRTLHNPLQPDAELLRQQTDIRVASDDRWSDIFTRILLEKVEPALNAGCPVIIHDYPRPEAALAKAHPADPRLARRFELYACGVELANAFEELTDPEEQCARFEADMALKAELYGERYPIDAGLLEALPHMPPTSGIALGFDRLVMLATGADRIDQVMWTPPGG